MATILTPIPFKLALPNKSADERLLAIWRRCDRSQKLIMLAIMERLVAAQNQAAARIKKAAVLPIAA